ncbi:hypothetical protein RMAECT_0135 [Rickettsia rhipicephali str. Ect]|uniref:Uncharacterized protein n=1 Tax=Rickettsia rhipicephali str. Ect TaxID=1359199 RepID=A0A0F3PD22_RICRH|nr:hypothetical protein RMAECT_0135 [Rickettsia rhipicephali str. Ect]
MAAGATYILLRAVTTLIFQSLIVLKHYHYLLLNHLPKVEQFNFAIDDFLASNEYKKIIKTYIYHILLPKSIDSRWCHVI